MIRRPLVSVVVGFVGTLVILAGATLWHIRAPLLRALPARTPGSEAARGPSPAEADVVLYLSRRTIADAAASGRFDALDLSWGWINTLSQEIGPFHVRDVTEGFAPDSELPPVVLWSRSASIVTDESTAATLERLASAGTIIVLEQPGPSLFSLAGFLSDPTPPDSDILWHRATGPEVAAEAPLGPEETRALSKLDLTVAMAGGAPAEHVEVLLQIGGRCAAIRRPLGSGTVITLLFDFSRLITSLQQGVPENDLSVTNRYSHRLADLIESNDLVASEMLLENDVPYADLLERLVIGWVEEARPIPSWWGYPEAAAGAFLMTHDDEGVGDRAAWMPEHEARIGAVSTSFFMPSGSLTAEGLAAMLADGTEIGIHWDRTASHDAVDDFMLGPLRVFRVERSLTKQITWLRTLLPDDRPVRVARSHFLQWGATWSETFRELAAAEIDVDSTYGVDYGTRGYLFATGRPFRPLDENGLPLPLLEMPQLGSEDLGGFDAEYLGKLLDDSRGSYHQAINVLFHPNNMAWIPSVGLYRHWITSYDKARAAGHRIMTVGDLHDFEAARSVSPLHSRWDGRRLRVAGEARADGMSVVVPARAGNRELVEVRGEDGPLRRRELTRMGRAAFLIPVSRGDVAVEVVYGEAR